jgi:Uma2 family endonuclease
MATVRSTPAWSNGYPTSDGKPMAETDWHRDLMAELISILKRHFENQPRVYVSGNLLVYYVPGNRRRRVAPDVFVVRGVPNHQRPNYLIWEEGRPPQVVIEVTASSTRNEDLRTKFHLYRDTLKVREYFLFDLLGDYLEPRLQGYRLRQGGYYPIRPYRGRLPSRGLGLHLEASGHSLRLHDPVSGRWLPTHAERVAEAELRAAHFERIRQEYEELGRPRGWV